MKDSAPHKKGTVILVLDLIKEMDRPDDDDAHADDDGDDDADDDDDDDDDADDDGDDRAGGDCTVPKSDKKPCRWD